ncbi:TIGR00730 family Rossman fold protein [Muricauda sp. MAR_2010_75]|uniref:LOG family protein n=1 Tax=Allomuricauda sp. MAR_2010_75 TaxID=1250232 RepID=UPI0005654317|nr:TIGR00730 family Rossman fold protein [Muricauda sp. MAR_2010_75]
MKSIVVFCASSEGNDIQIVDRAYELGKTLAKQDRTLVYGGSKLGLMGKVANGALDNNGKVIGVLPNFLKSKEIVHDRVPEMIIVDSMHERKMKMYELSDGIIALPGGFGTLEELFEIITWGQLGLHQKPMGILNVNGFYDELLAFLDTMVVRELLKIENRNMLLVDDSCRGLLEQMESYRPVTTPKWIKKEHT